MTPGKSCLELGAVMGWSDKSLWRRVQVCFHLWRLDRVESLDYNCNWHLTKLKVRPRTPPVDSWRSRCLVSAFCDCIFDMCCSSFLSFILFTPFSYLKTPKFHTEMNQFLNFSVITLLLHPLCAFIGLWWKTINLAKNYWATQER